MCVIITKPASASIPHSHLAQGNRSNPHGWGVAARVNGEIVIRRGFSTTDLIAAYEEFKNHAMVVHCRIGTSGGNTIENTHPFEVIPGVVMFHNGIFRDIPLTTPKRSDTWHLAQQLRPMFEQDPELHLNKDFREQMLAYCTRGYVNKLVFFTAKNTIVINKAAGVEHANCWYSNFTAFPPPKVDYTAAATSWPNVTRKADKPRKSWPRKGSVKPRALTSSESQSLRLRTETTPEDLEQLLIDMPDIIEDEKRKAARAAQLEEDSRFQRYIDSKYNGRRRR